MTLKVTEGSDDVVTVYLRGKQRVSGASYERVSDYTVETKDGMVLHLGDCFVVGNHICPVSVVEKVTARQTEVREVPVYGVAVRFNSRAVKDDSDA